MIKLLTNSVHGFSLVEIMVSLAIIAGTTLGLNGAIGNMAKDMSVVKVSSTSKNIVEDLINAYTTRASSLQIDYGADTPAQILRNLPIAWDDNGNRTPVIACQPKCPKGRLGVVVKPITGAKGLYEMTIKIKHEEWKDDKYIVLVIGD